jgi:O-antigen/teichoic acid export membrane protein
VAREVAMGRLGTGAELAATLAVWRRTLWAACAAVAVAAALLREPLAALLSVDEAWAAAATLPTGCLWLLLSVERGALQGLHAYRPVAWSLLLEAVGRLAIGLVLVAAGLGVSGAYLGTPLTMLIVADALPATTSRRLGRPATGHVGENLRELMRGAWPAVLGLFLVAVLQNVDVILVKRRIGGDEAGAYAAAAVAAKAVVWMAIGVGLYLLPAAVRRAREGLDPRPVLLRALAIVGLVALPMLAAYAVAPRLVLRLAFGEETVVASGALFTLGLAMTLLAAGYLCVQYMLALRRVTFLYVLAAVAGAEIVVLSGAGLSSIEGFAVVVLGLQAAAAVAVLALGLTRRSGGVAVGSA